MAFTSVITLGLTLVALRGAIAQSVENQVNISMCNWRQLRANVIRDTIYLDGGYLWWQRGFSDGEVQQARDDNPDGTLFSLTLSTPFDTTGNLTGLFNRTSKAGGAANNIAPNYGDGAMFASDYEFILYGGLLRLTDSSTPPSAKDVLSYERYQWGPPKTLWRPGFNQITLPDGVTRYITHGAAVSVPSENLAFYFSGKHGKNWGEITKVLPQANLTANTLISVDMSEFRNTKWTNTTLPDNIPGRGNAELVWIPVSLSGVLVAIGGVVNPEDIFGGPGPSTTQIQENNSTDPGFMSSVPIYDIANGKWYMQNTTGDPPPPLSQFCSVVAAAKDRSSFNIYIYGGYDGTDSEKRPSDDVYVLSLPSFTWIKVYTGTSTHGRNGHKCVKPYPDQMFVIGGEYLDPSLCVEGGIIQVFNLNTLKFQNNYDPNMWSNYKVPSLVTAKIGGDADGGATMRSPPSWADHELETLFGTEYAKNLSIWYPYPLINASATPSSTPASPGGGGLPKWVGPVLGVILGLIFITGLVLCWLLWRRRYDKLHGDSETATSANRKRVLRWMYTMPSKLADGTTETSTAIGINEDHKAGFSDVIDADMASTHPGSTAGFQDRHEVLGSPVHEMQGFTTLNELPTDFNVVPGSPQERRISNSSPMGSPVSPGLSPSPNTDLRPMQPTHARHHSSISSGPPISIDDTVASEPGSPRPHYVSGFREHLAGPDDAGSPREPR